MLRKSLIAFTAATVVGFGSQAEAAGFSHAMSAPEIPIAKLDRKGLIGKRMYDHQGPNESEHEIFQKLN